MTLHVLFDFDKSTLTEADLKELQKAVTFVKKYPGGNIRLDGYTDYIGTDAYNIKLSEGRARAVKDYLIKEAGVSSSRITAVGHGKADPVADNKTAEGRAKNRRVEISILSDLMSETSIARSSAPPFLLSRPVRDPKRGMI